MDCTEMVCRCQSGLLRERSVMSKRKGSPQVFVQIQHELGLDGLHGPGRQGIGIFDHVNGHLVEGF